MSERYTKLFSLPENLYAEGSPVIIAAGALLKDTQTDKILAHLKLRSIASKRIKAASVRIQPLDIVGNPLEETAEHQYLDLDTLRDGYFGAKNAIPLPATARAFTVGVENVVFEDNSVWTADGAAWERLQTPQSLASLYSSEVVEQFQIEYGKNARNLFREQKDLWTCVCGADNRTGEAHCHRCANTLQGLRGIDAAQIKANAAARMKKQRQAAAAEMERARIQAKKNRKSALIATCAVAVCVAFIVLLNTVIIPNSKYNDALSLMDEGKYEEAITAFDAMNGYKGSIEKIAQCYTGISDREYNDALALMAVGQYEEAIAAFEALDGYKDSAEQLTECNYLSAVSLMDAGQYTEAISAFEALDGYKDSAEQITEIRKLLLKNARVGDYVCFGTYEQDNNTSNGKEAIEWLVLEVKDGKALLISKYALDCKPYNTSRTAVTWETCSLRKWLNGDFLNAAFSDEEKAMIPTVTVSAGKNPDYSTNPGNATQDQVFLLSITEVNQYFSSDRSRQCKPTDYAVANGAYVNNGSGNCWWWLRSPGYNQSHAASVNRDGDVREGGRDVSSAYDAVRPALWIDLS